MLTRICAAVSEASGVKVGIGNVPLNQIVNYRGELGSAGERAKDVLLRTLQAIDSRFSWLLLYGPSSNDRMYYLNVIRIAAPEGQVPVETGP